MNKKLFYIFILVILFIILLHFYLYYLNVKRNSPILIKGLVDGKQNNDNIDLDENGDSYNYKYRINSDIIPSSGTELTFSYSFWLFLEDAGSNANWSNNYKEVQTVINRGDSPLIGYIPYNNSLVIKIKSGKKGYEIFELPYFLKLQRWNFICICLNNRDLDIYLDGELHSSYILKEVPKLDGNDIYIFDSGNIYAKLSYFRYFNYSIMPRQAKNIYKKTSIRNKITSFLNIWHMGREKNTPVPNKLWWLDFYPLLNYFGK